MSENLHFLRTSRLQDYSVWSFKKFYRKEHEKNTFIFIYVTSQKSGFQFPHATSRQSHEGSRVYITTQF
jgi:hypothetical protein